MNDLFPYEGMMNILNNMSVISGNDKERVIEAFKIKEYNKEEIQLEQELRILFDMLNSKANK